MKNYITAWALVIIGTMYHLHDKEYYAILFLVVAIINFVLSYITWSKDS